MESRAPLPFVAGWTTCPVASVIVSQAAGVFSIMSKPKFAEETSDEESCLVANGEIEPFFSTEVLSVCLCNHTSQVDLCMHECLDILVSSSFSRSDRTYTLIVFICSFASDKKQYCPALLCYCLGALSASIEPRELSRTGSTDLSIAEASRRSAERFERDPRPIVSVSISWLFWFISFEILSNNN